MVNNRRTVLIHLRTEHRKNEQFPCSCLVCFIQATPLQKSASLHRSLNKDHTQQYLHVQCEVLFGWERQGVAIRAHDRIRGVLDSEAGRTHGIKQISEVTSISTITKKQTIPFTTKEHCYSTSSTKNSHTKHHTNLSLTFARMTVVMYSKISCSA